jgi:hypothetical protein
MRTLIFADRSAGRGNGKAVVVAVLSISTGATFAAQYPDLFTYPRELHDQS